ncbi:ArsR/SmtB family transcription factor [Arvimicrobium flavum]|uniref:ArsR/SmtB family transcription factor n=1 Tax=Arvimicrobium flavum TaxID=3393320 RepID=UPI00237AD4FF|nr:metalloregulator ArsR/SmtB family transcription factor [Mesorhizobium shangrilense]
MNGTSASQDDCCAPVASRDVSLKLAALSHPVRIEILARVAGLGPCCCKDVVACLDLAQSTVSQHLKILVDAGLLSYAPDRQRSRYEIDRATMAELSAQVARFADACCRLPNPKA